MERDDFLKRNLLRYLGLGKNTPDEATNTLADETIALLKQTARPKSVWKRFPLTTKDGICSFAGMDVSSQSLERNLKGCGEIIIFAATLGAEVDMLMRRLEATAIYRAAALQAGAAAMIEEYCNEEQDKLRKLLSEETLYLRPRFSPGYGDFPITFQRSMLDSVNAQKQIGLTVTDSMILAPMKSVTAVIGITPHEEPCPKQGCEECTNKNCQFRLS